MVFDLQVSWARLGWGYVCQKDTIYINVDNNVHEEHIGRVTPSALS